MCARVRDRQTDRHRREVLEREASWVVAVPGTRLPAGSGHTAPPALQLCSCPAATVPARTRAVGAVRASSVRLSFVEAHTAFLCVCPRPGSSRLVAASSRAPPAARGPVVRCRCARAAAGRRGGVAGALCSWLKLSSLRSVRNLGERTAFTQRRPLWPSTLLSARAWHVSRGFPASHVP